MSAPFQKTTPGRRSRTKAPPAPIDFTEAPIALLVHQMDSLGVKLRPYGRDLRVEGVSLLSADLKAIAQTRSGEILKHIGGYALDGPPLALLEQLKVKVVVPQNDEEAVQALDQIARDSDQFTPDDIKWRGGIVALDVETEVLPGMEERPPVKLIKKTGELYKKQPAFKSKAGLDPHRSKIRLVQLYAGGETVVVIDTHLVSLDVLARILKARTCVIHNALFELHHFAEAGFEIENFECTLQAAGLLLGVRRRGLDDAVAAYLNIEVPKDLQKSDWSAPNLTPGQIGYAAIDPIVTWQLWLILRRELVSKGRGGAYLLQRDVLWPVARMMARGFWFDRKEHAKQIIDWEAGKTEKADAFEVEAKQPLPDTPAKVIKYLRAILSPTQLASWPRTPKGALSTAKSDLRRIAQLSGIELILEFKEFKTLLNSFGTKLTDKISPKTGKLHPGFNIALAKSGRASSYNPNSQQFPSAKRAPDFRNCFVVIQGWVLITADYGLMELRAAASKSGDPQMTADLANGVDLHTQQAAEMLGIAQADVDRKSRDKAKAINFGIIFGSRAAGLAASAWSSYGVELSIEEAEAARNIFLSRYRVYHQWMELNHAQAVQNGYITIGNLGRLIEAEWEAKKIGNGAAQYQHSKNGEFVEDGEYEEDYDEDYNDYHNYNDNNYPNDQEVLKYTLCCNAPIQGACADCSMLALLKVDSALREAGIPGGPVLWIHDELVIAVPEEYAEQAKQILIDEMTAAFAETFPNAPLNSVVDAKIGRTWAESKP